MERRVGVATIFRGFLFYNMAQDKKGFILYADQQELFNKLPNDKAGELIKHIFAYVNDENPTTDDLLIDLAFTPIKQQLKRDLIKFELVKKQRSEAGKASAEARARARQRNPTPVETVERKPTKSTVNDNVNVKVNDKVNVNVKVNKNIEERKAEFKNSLHPFLESYSKDLLNEFYSYWTEHGSNDKKMRFEKEKSFGISRRLSTWKKNEEKFGRQNQKSKFEKGQDVFLQLMLNDPECQNDPAVIEYRKNNNLGTLKLEQ